MNQWRNPVLVAVTLAGLALTSACQNESRPEPVPPAESSNTTAATPRASPTPAPAWESTYTPRQLRAYEAALRRYQEYETKSEPIWRAGKATAQTEQFFKEYFFAWRNQQRLLTTYEQVDVQIHGTPTVLRSQPTRVAFADDDSESVTIRQCADYSNVTGYQYGKPTKRVANEPQIRVAVLTRFAGQQQTPWQITELRTSKGNRPCGAR